MITATVHEAKTHFSKLLRRLALGEEVIILRGKTPAAKLVPLSNHRARTPGFLRGRYRTPETILEPLPEDELRAWEPRA
jgi:antitoxin (DNA-binding transcriptional repressor) of toxin-antitoxin stability system